MCARRDRHEGRQATVRHVEPPLGVHRDRLRQPEPLAIGADRPGAEKRPSGAKPWIRPAPRDQSATHTRPAASTVRRIGSKT
jgi:hypothetical protein